MGILNLYRNEFKKTRVKNCRMSTGEIKEELRLITEKKSTLSARQRRSVMKAAVDLGIAKIV